ncbi:MAG TPA: hypothetical protein VLK65_13380 [Vicinamibacteria bacterium]|nr:hypothetical protein [Vicinamibacteria bacterium]
MFGIRPIDPVTYLGAAATLMTLLARWVPAVRATPVDPSLVHKAE